MKKMIALTVVSIGCLTACGNQPMQTPAQVAAKACPPAQAAIASLQAIIGLPPTLISDLTKITPVVDDACIASVAITSDSLAALSITAFPALTSIVKSSPLSDEQKNTLIADLGIGQVALDLYIAVAPAAVQAEQTSAVTK